MYSDENFINYYNVLGISNESNFESIRKSYKELVLKFHPDINHSENANSQFKLVLKAYNTLKNSETKSIYDQELKKNSSFFKRINFKYSYKKIKEKKDEIFNKIKLVFKNKFNNDKISNRDYLKDSYVEEHILDMEIDELGERLLYSDNPYVKMHSAMTLGLKGDLRGLFYLEKAIDNEIFDIKKSVVLALGNIRSKKSLHILKKLFFNNDTILRVYIFKSIESLTLGKGYLFDKILNHSLKSPIPELRFYALEIAVKHKKSQNFDSLTNIFKNMDNITDNNRLSYNGG